MSKHFKYQLHEIDDAAKFIIDNLSSNIILMNGDMGSGKTTLVKAVVKQLGSTDEVSSPTFSIVNEYITPESKIYHFDLYRLNDEVEALDFGIEEYLSDSNALVFIEWAEIIKDLLPDNLQKIRIIVSDINSRELLIE